MPVFAHRRQRSGVFARFLRDERGQAAVEFAFIALPFFTLLLSAIDFGLMFFAGSALENGINQAARMVRTGEVQASGMTEQQFKQALCDQVSMFLDCGDQLAVDVRVFDSFANTNPPASLDGDGNLAGNFQFSPGQPGDVVLVRAFYSWPMLTPILGEALSNMNGQSRLLTASVAFRNEPFGAILGN
jgi:Flp pilus assembly protein TadG